MMLFLIFLGVILLRFVQPSDFTRGLFGLIACFCFVIYLIFSYWIFKPSKQVRHGAVIAVVNGIFLAFAVVTLLVRIILPGNSFIGSGFLIYHVGLTLFVSVLLFQLFKRNKVASDNLPYVRSVLVRNGIIFLLYWLLILSPRELLAGIFYARSSEVHYEVLQTKCNEAAKLYNRQDMSEKAIEKAKEAVEYSKLRMDINEGLFQESMNILGYAYYKNSEYAKADSIFKEVLYLNENGIYEDEDEYEDAIYKMGLLYSSWGYYHKSDSVFHLYLNKYEVNSQTLAYIFETLGNNAKQRSNFFEADSLYKKAMAYHEETDLGDIDNYLSTMRSRGYVGMGRGQYAQADSIFQSALFIARKKMGENSIEVADALDALVNLNITIAKYDVAKGFCEKSLLIKGRILGSEHVDYLISRLDLAAIYIALSSYKEAQSILAEALAIAERKHDSRSPIAATIYDNLFSLYKDYERFTEAVVYANRSLEARNYWFGEFDLRTAVSIDNKAYIEYCFENYVQADSLYQASLKIEKYYLGNDHTNYALSINGLALVYSRTSSAGKADSAFNFASDIIEKSVGKQHPFFATILHNKAYLKLREEKFSISEQQFNESMNINKKIFGNAHIKVAENYLGIAELKAKMGQYDAALKNYQEALAIYKKIFSFQHPKVGQINTEMEEVRKKKIMENIQGSN